MPVNFKEVWEEVKPSIGKLRDEVVTFLGSARDTGLIFEVSGACLSSFSNLHIFA